MADNRTCIASSSGIDIQIEKQIRSELTKWREILKRIIHVILFLSERGLAFRGTSQKLGVLNNSNFLGIIELLSHYDSILKEHIEKVIESQKSGHRFSVHYLSSDLQNEFISACGELVRTTIIKELKGAKYFSIIVDATPDSSHTEQITFILRYLSWDDDSFNMEERFVEFMDCNKKTGAEISQLILRFLQNHDLDIDDCRGKVMIMALIWLDHTMVHSPI